MKFDLNRAWLAYCDARGGDQNAEYEAAHSLLSNFLDADVVPVALEALAVQLSGFDRSSDPSELEGAIQGLMANRGTRSQVKRLLLEAEGTGEPRAQRSTWPVDEQIPPRDWLIRNWLPAGRVSLLVGRGGVGKSTLGLQIAAAIASGVHTWLPSQDGTECSLLTCLKDRRMSFTGALKTSLRR